MQLKDFFRATLPANGPYCLSVNASRNTWFQTVDQLALGAQAAEAARSPNDSIYYSAASFAAPSDRNDVNVATRRAFVLDVDVHGKVGEFTNVAQAIQALSAHMQRGDLPKASFVVHTGRGLQVYWNAPIDAPVHIWRQVCAGMLSHIAVTCDPRFLVDTGTARRVSGVYRVPTTTNPKLNPPAIASLIAAKGSALDKEWFRKWFTIGAGVRYTSQESHTPMIGDTDGAFGSLTAHELVPLKETVAGCAQLRHAIVHPETTDYTGWLAVARILRHVPEGETVFHKWSARDSARYDKDHAATKWADVWKMSAGVTCQSLAEAAGDHVRARCQTCPVFLKAAANSKPGSPLRAHVYVGVDNLPVVETPPAVTAPVGLPSPPPSGVADVAGADTVLPALPARPLLDDGFVDFTVPAPPPVTAMLPSFLVANSTGAGRYYVNADMFLMQRGIPHTDPKKARPDKKLASCPFWITAESVDEILDDHGATTHGFTLNVYDPARKEVYEHVLPVGATSGGPADICKALHIKRVTIDLDAQREVAQYVIANIERVRSSIATQDTTPESFGWTRDMDSFVVGSTRYLGNGNCERVVIGGGRLGEISKQQRFGPHGSRTPMLRILKAIADSSKFSPDFKMRLLIPAASALMRMTPVQSAAVITRGIPGTGKTMASELGMAIWGKATMALGGSSDTLNAMREIANRCGSLPYGVDDLVVQDDTKAKVIGEFIMDLTSATGALKNRLNSDAGLRRGENHWNGLVLVNTNSELQSIFVGEGDPTEAIRARALVFDVNTHQTPLGLTDSDGQDGGFSWMRTLGKSMQHGDHGHLGAAFADYIVTHRVAVRAAVQAAYDKYSGSRGRGEDARFVPSIYAAIKVAGDILAKITGITDMDNWLDSALSGARTQRKGGTPATTPATAPTTGAVDTPTEAKHASSIAHGEENSKNAVKWTPTTILERIARSGGGVFPRFVQDPATGTFSLVGGSGIPSQGSLGAILSMANGKNVCVFSAAALETRGVWEGPPPRSIPAVLEKWCNLPNNAVRRTDKGLTTVLSHLGCPTTGFWDGAKATFVANMDLDQQEKEVT